MNVGTHTRALDACRDVTSDKNDSKLKLQTYTHVTDTHSGNGLSLECCTISVLATSIGHFAEMSALGPTSARLEIYLMVLIVFVPISYLVSDVNGILIISKPLLVNNSYC